ncbi:hypothetical protein B0H17DRAFT_1208802 [Mycena rosella]|uniref:Uncharacterized protein n=1 Tax=Mycena rosella TaxID=1033263 RepID=A0AAD7GAB2_MYCRO|nr:hypothetical protein B0H17DRAFT_1208802 [Mycena rosella]
MWEDEGPICLAPVDSDDELLTERDLRLLGPLAVASPEKQPRQRKRARTGGSKQRTRRRPSIPVQAASISTPPFSLTAGQESEVSSDGGTLDLWDNPDPDPSFNDSAVQALDTSDNDYQDFAEGVTIGTIGFYRVSKTFVVCEGWTGGTSNGKWYHLQWLEGHANIFICTCPRQGQCYHERYMRDKGFEAFSNVDEEYVQDSACKVALFSRELSSANDTISIFSVATPHRLEVLKARAIMTNVGDGTGHGTWKCNEDPGSGCPHVSVASKFLRRINGETEPADDDDDTPLASLEGSHVATTVVPPKAISYLPILPPVWATLPEDPDLYPRPSPMNPPAVFALGLEARCTCGAARRMADPTTRRTLSRVQSRRSGTYNYC